MPKLNQLIADRLLQRLDVVRFQPMVILDVGAQTGYTTRALAARYRKASVVGLDVSHQLLTQSQTGFPWRRPNMITTRYTALPFAKQSVDMIFANLALLTPTDIAQTLQEFHRLLRPEGLLFLTTLGRDTVVEARINSIFPDMHDIGDQLTRHHFADPVMDVEYLTLRYSNAARLHQDMESLHALDKTSLSTIKNLFDAEQKLSLTLELIYGHAWGSKELPSMVNQQGEILIPISAINRG